MLSVYRKLEAGEQIVIGCDTSYGVNDYCVAQFYSRKHFDVPLVWKDKTICTEMTNALYPILEKVADITNYKPIVAYEMQNGGSFELSRLASMNRLGKYEIFKMPKIGVLNPQDTERIGWDTNSATRPEMLSNLKEQIDNRLINIYDKQTIEELYSFIVVQTSSLTKAQAERNSHDDCVMSLAIALKVAEMSTSHSLRNIASQHETYTDLNRGRWR